MFRKTIRTERRETAENRLYTVEQNRNFNDLKKYVKEHIKALKCTRFVQKGDGSFCQCGALATDHKINEIKDNGRWDKDKDLKLIPTNAYGEMKLSGFRGIAGIQLKYIRAFESDSICHDLEHIMTKLWEFKKPELIISINGGAKKMIPLSNQHKSALKRGIINVSKAASTWIITGGFNFGVSKLVGEAARDYIVASQDKSFTVLGIGTWGAVYNRKDLVNKNNDLKVTYNNADGSSTLKGQAPLDPNHDAFILIDGGIEKVFGMEIEFRAKFEMFISKRAKCSVVQVIVEGGKKCIITADEALKQGIPVVVMKGSKRAADLICDVVEADDNTMEDIIDGGLATYKEEWTIVKQDEMDTLKNHLKSLHKFRKEKLIHIFSMSDFTKNLDRAILEAAFSGKIDGKELTSEEKLKMAMTFNRPDVAEETVLESSASRNPIKDYGEYIKTALIKNQWKFVDLFLSRGTQVESFLTKQFLEDLYFGKKVNRHINANTLNIIQFLKDSVTSSDKKTLSTIGLIVQKLTKNLIRDMYRDPHMSTNTCCNANDDNQVFTEPEKVTDFEKYKEIITISKKKKNANGSCMPCPYEYEEKTCRYTNYPTVNKDKERIYTEQDLFIWALLTQRVEMAKLFWENGKDHIGSALVASMICGSMSKVANKEGEAEMMVMLQNSKEEFENLAISILTEAYWRDKTRTHLLLIRALPYWGRATCMEIANRSQQINFMSHSACQTRLNSIWLGGMSMYTNTFLFLLNLPFAFLTSKLFIFRSKRTDDYEEKTSSLDSSKVESFDSSTNDKNGIVAINITTNDSHQSGEKSKKNQEYLTRFRRKQQLAWQNVSFRQAVSFYYHAPITKFTMHILSYLLFLTIFSYTCLVELLPLSVVTKVDQRQMEYAVYTYMLSFVLEKIRQSVAGSQIDTVKGKMSIWISSLWNVYDLILYIMFGIAVILRHTLTIDSNFVYPRTLFSTCLSMFFLRFLQFYYANRSIGPKVISVSRMLKDIIFFLALYVIAIFAYGTFAHALLYNNSPLNGVLLKNMVYMPYWQSYGDLNIEYVEGNLVKNNGINNVTPTPNAIVIVGFAFYMLFTNALLMNMLVAMFGMTFQKVEENSNKIWAFNRYQLIEEFYLRPILPPPLNVFEIIWMALQACRCTPRNTQKLKRNDLIVNLYHEEDLRSSGFEQQCLETYLIDNHLIQPINDVDQSSSINNSTVDRDITSSGATDAISSSTNEKWMMSVNETMNEMKLEIKSIVAQMHKVRRHQKKEGNQSRSNTIVREPKMSTRVQNVLPMDNDETN